METSEEAGASVIPPHSKSSVHILPVSFYRVFCFLKMCTLALCVPLGLRFSAPRYVPGTSSRDLS